MIKKITQKAVGLLVILTLMTGMMLTGSIQTRALTGTITVKIADVTRRYREARSFLQMINDYRKEHGVSELTMDKDYLEGAMLRAAELSLYASEYSPNGRDGLSYITGISDGGQLIAYDVLGYANLLNNFKNNGDSNEILLNARYKSVGVGSVEVNGVKYVCILESPKKPVAAEASVLEQVGVTVNQEVEVQPDVISQMSPAYGDGYGVSVGSSLPAYVRVANKKYSGAFVYLTTYNAAVTFGTPGIFTCSNDRIYAQKAGTSTVTITYNGNASLSATCRINAVGKSLGSCTFDPIPGQLYTGSPLCPKVTGTDAGGNSLVQGTDFSVSYSNNINVGTAKVTVKGLGAYAGQTKELSFSIISGGDDPSKTLTIKVTASKSELETDESTIITAVPTGGTNPIRYTFAYAPYGTEQWTTLVANTTSTTYSFKPGVAKKYYVRVTATDSKSLTASQTVIVNVLAALRCSVSASPASLNAGGLVKITATGTGGRAPLNYAFYVKKPGASGWISVHDYSTERSITYRPSNVGSYEFCAKCKSANGSIEKAYVTVKVNQSALTNLSTVSPTEIDLGQKITMKGSGKSATGLRLSYAYLYKKNSETNWTTVKSYSADTTAVWKPAEAGHYSVCIKVRDTDSRIEKKYFDITVHKKLVNNSVISASSVVLGGAVRITGKAANGSSGYQYAAYYRRVTESSFRRIRDFSSDAAISFKPAEKGNYVLRVKVKDSVGAVVDKDINLKVTPALTNISKVESTTVNVGGSVKITCAASGGTSPYQYAVFYKKSAVSDYTRSSDFGSSTARTLKLTSKGKYNLRIKVKDAAGRIAAKDFVITVQ